MAEGLIRCDEDDPRRCQGVGRFGQCRFLAIEGASGCQIHAGAHHARALARKTLRKYHLGRLQPEYDKQMEAGDIKHLHEEVCITRLLLQQHLNQMLNGNETEMLRMSPVVQGHLQLIERLVKTMDHIDKTSGLMIDKVRAQNLGVEIAEVVALHVLDPDTMLKISDGISQVLERLNEHL